MKFMKQLLKEKRYDELINYYIHYFYRTNDGYYYYNNNSIIKIVRCYLAQGIHTPLIIPSKEIKAYAVKTLINNAFQSAF